MKLNTKLLINYIVIGAILLVGSGFYIETRLRESKFQSLQETFIMQLYQLDVTISDFLSGVEYDVENLAANELVRTQDDDEFTQFLEADEQTFTYNIGETEQQIIAVFNNYRMTHPYANSVYMGRENGCFVRSHKRNRPTQYDPRLRPWYEIAMATPSQVVRTAPYRSVTTSDINIGTVKALIDQHGKAYGVVGIDVTLVNLANYISNTSIGRDGSIILLDNNGIILTHPDENALFKVYDEAGLDYFQPVMENDRGHTIFTQRDPDTDQEEEFYVFYHTSPKLGWKVSAVIPAAEINAEINQFTKSANRVFALALLVLSALIALSVQILVVKPVTELQQTTQIIMQTGQLDHRLAVKSKDEIGQLTASFNQMIGTLKIKETELEEHRENLEDLVAARTSELGKSIDNAQELNRQLAQEIAERKQAVDALQISERNFKELSLLKKAILESPQGIIVFALDKDYCYLEFTLLHQQTMKAIWGVNIEVGQNMLDYIKFKPDREKAQKNFDRALSGEQFIIYEEYGDEKLQRTFYEDRYGPILDEAGNIIGLAVYVIDITERKLATEKLHESERKYRTIFDATSDALFIHDETGKIIDVNQRMCEVFGYSCDEVSEITLGKLSQGTPPYSEADAATKVRLALEVGPQIFKWRSKRSDGTLFWSEVALQPSIIDGESRVIAAVRDITERVRIEEMMVQSEKMLSVGGLAAGMAHEINNPLAGMMQTADVMATRLSQDLPANLRAAEEAGTSMAALRAFMQARGIPRMLADIHQSGRRVAEIVTNMLSFARRSESQFSSHDIAELLDKALELATTDYDLKKQYDFKTIQLTKEFEPDLPLVSCEGGKIQQVFLNILRNGAQSMQRGRTEADLQQHAEAPKPHLVLRLAHEPEIHSLRIEIEDNGPGMDEATRKRVFEPFFTTKPVGEGTGLGLSVSYFIITENHGGTLDVISEPGKGANFIIRLPLERIEA